MVSILLTQEIIEVNSYNDQDIYFLKFSWCAGVRARQDSFRLFKIQLVDLIYLE
jgi:hypothetical protein